MNTSVSCLFILFRNFVGKLQPPVIPFMPLLLKDMTFAHEGNKTSLDGLVNFEKMHMMAQTMRTIRFCRSRHLGKIEYYSFLIIEEFQCLFSFSLLNSFGATITKKWRRSEIVYKLFQGYWQSKDSTKYVAQIGGKSSPIDKIRLMNNSYIVDICVVLFYLNYTNSCINQYKISWQSEVPNACT